MGYRIQRLGFQFSRGWFVAIALVLGGLLAAYWIGPLRPLPPEVAILAVANGELSDEVSVSGEYLEEEQSLRFPVQLTARNTGVGTARPRRVVLNVPARFRLITPRGRLNGEASPGVPLRRYVVDLPESRLEEDGQPQPLPGLEQIWLEPDLPAYYCTDRGDLVPEFVPAPAIDAGTLSDVRIFYSVHMRDRSERSTGVLTVRLDASQLSVQPAAMPPAFPTEMGDDVPPPDLGVLRFVGVRKSWCGDPDQPMELYTAMWEGSGGSRVYSVHVQGVPRKRLFDLNGDGVIDLETWDVDGDGQFDSRRQARFATPEMLVPLPPRDPSLREPISTPPDPRWLAVFTDASQGPFRFAAVAGMQEEVAVDPGADQVAGESPDPAAPGATGTVALGPLPPPDSAWLAMFQDVNAGPFRFTRRPAQQPAARAPAPPAEPAQPGAGTQPGAAAQAGQAGQDTVAPPPAAEPEPQPAPQPAPQPRRVPLGTPVRPDTVPPQ